MADQKKKTDSLKSNYVRIFSKKEKTETKKGTHPTHDDVCERFKDKTSKQEANKTTAKHAAPSSLAKSTKMSSTANANKQAATVCPNAKEKAKEKQEPATTDASAPFSSPPKKTKEDAPINTAKPTIPIREDKKATTTTPPPILSPRTSQAWTPITHADDGYESFMQEQDQREYVMPHWREACEEEDREVAQEEADDLGGEKWEKM